jgi:hypothetical protein
VPRSFPQLRKYFIPTNYITLSSVLDRIAAYFVVKLALQHFEFLSNSFTGEPASDCATTRSTNGSAASLSNLIFFALVYLRVSSRIHHAVNKIKPSAGGSRAAKSRTNSTKFKQFGDSSARCRSKIRFISLCLCPSLWNSFI